MVRGFDLRDVFTGRMSWRRLRVLLMGLPVESEYKTALRNQTDLSELREPDPGVFGPWSQTDHLLARVGDLLQHLAWQNAGNADAPRPEPYPRPGVKPRSPSISDEAMAYLAYLREHHGEAPPDDWTPA